MKKHEIDKPIIKHLKDHEKALNIIVSRLGLADSVDSLIKDNPQTLINILILIYVVVDVVSKF